MAALAHVVSRMQADIKFLVSQNVISATDGQFMSDKLRGTNVYTPTLLTPATSPTPSLPTARRGVPLPPASRETQAPQARALWPYNEDGREADDLSFGAGEIVEIIKKTNADWWEGKNSRGERGLFPSNYVEDIAGNPVQTPSLGGRMVPPMPNEKATYNPMPTAPPGPPVQEQQQEPPKKNKFGKYGGTMAQSAAGGVGFGAGAAIGGGLVRAIF